MSCCWRYYLGSGCWADGESARAAIYDFSWRLDFVNFNMEICSLKHLISLCLWGELAKTAHQSDFFMKCIMHFLNMFCFHWVFLHQMFVNYNDIFASPSLLICMAGHTCSHTQHFSIFIPTISTLFWSCILNGIFSEVPNISSKLVPKKI